MSIHEWNDDTFVQTFYPLAEPVRTKRLRRFVVKDDGIIRGDFVSIYMKEGGTAGGFIVSRVEGNKVFVGRKVGPWLEKQILRAEALMLVGHTNAYD